MTDKQYPPSDKVVMTPIESPSKKTKIANWVVLVALGLTTMALCTLLFWSFQSDDVLNVKNSPVPVRTVRPHPTADGVVILQTDFCKNSNAIGKLRLSFVSASREVFLPVAEDKSSKRCEKTEIPVLIPKDLAPGMYKVKFRITYDVNPLKRAVVEEFESKEFEVVAP